MNFKEWTISAKQSLDEQYTDCNIELDFKNLGRCHWSRLWKIFRNIHSSRLSYGYKNELIDGQDILYGAENVILGAHGLSHKHLDWQLQLTHYLTSSQYDD